MATTRQPYGNRTSAAGIAANAAAAKKTTTTTKKITTVSPASTVKAPTAVVTKPGVNIPGVNVDMSRLTPNARSVQAAHTVQEADHLAAQMKQRQDLINQQRAALNKEKADLEKAKAAGIITQDEYLAQKQQHQNQDTLLTQSALRTGQTMDIAQNSATEQDRFLGGSIRAIDPTTRQMTPVNPDGTAKTALDPKGVIAQKAVQRLREAGLTDQQIEAKVSDPAFQQNIQETFSNTGQGGSFDQKTGKFIPAASLGKNPVADEYNRREKEKADEIASTVVMKTVYGTSTSTDADGNATTVNDGSSWEVIDQEATDAAREEVRMRQEQEDAANADAAAVLEEERKKRMTMPTLDTFISTLPEDQQESARTQLAPIEEFYDKAAIAATEKAKENISEEMDGFAEIEKYQEEADAKNNYFATIWKEMQDKSLQGKLDAAQTQREIDDKELKYQQAKKDAELDQAIRRQMVQNEKDRKDQLMGLGISGGWRSTRISADTIFALQRGEEIVADLRTEKALSSDYFATKSFEIERTYHSTVSTAYDTYEQNGFEAMQKFAEQADKIENTVYSRKKDKKTAIQKMEDDWFDFMTENGEGKLKMIQDGQKNLVQQVQDERDYAYKIQKDTYDDAMSYINQYGTQNKAALTTFEKRLGLAPGTLSNQKSLAELRMKKSGTGTGGAGATAASSIVGKLRTQLLRERPELASDGKQLDSAVLETVQNNYSGMRHEELRRDIQDYVNDNNYAKPSTWEWMGEGAVPSTAPKTYFVNYKFRPTFEQNVYQLDSDTAAGLESLTPGE